MTILEILLIALSLAMDCFTVSIVSGSILQRWHTSVILRIAVLFGLFQGLMPLLGWLAFHFFSSSLESYGHWIAFVLLLFIGGKMIWQSLTDSDETPAFRPDSLVTQLLLAVATSIDALAVGVSMAVTGYHSLSSLLVPLSLIGGVAFLMSLLGHWLGIRFGRAISSRLKPELLGGIILVIIGVKVVL